MSEIAGFVKEVVPEATLSITGEAGNDPRSYQVDFSKIGRHLPAYQPAWTALKGAEQLYEAYQRLDLTMDTFQRLYKRLPILQQHREQGLLDDMLRWT